MKKRIIALALTLLMLCSLLAGCGKQSTYKTVEEALARTQALEEMSVKIEMDRTISTESMSMSIPMTMEIKAKDAKSSTPTILTKLSLSMLGQTVSTEIYQEDGWSYAVMGDMKTKTKSAPQLDQYDYSEEMMQMIPEALMKYVELEKGENGSATATITIPGEKFTEIYSDLVDSLGEDLSGAEDLTVKDAVVIISVAGGYVEAYEMSFSLEAYDGDEVSSLTVDASITYENPGKPVEITPPEGYKDFKEQ